jgi:membrane-associated phospholipid phosphatase
MRQIFYLFLILLFTTSASCGAGFDSTFVGKTLKHGYISSRDLMLSPVGWDKTDFLVLGTVSAATAASVIWLDTPVNNFFKNHHHKSINTAFHYLEPMGNKYIGLTMAGLALHGVIAKKNYSLETALIIGESYVLNGILVQATKHLAGRSRPYDSRGPDPLRWEGPLKGSSFYSGHTSSAFSAASVIAWRYRDTAWVPWLSYSLATLGGIQRIYHNQHWLSDTIFGAMAGTAIGLFLAKNHEDNPYKIYPMVQPGANGITMVLEIGKN